MAEQIVVITPDGEELLRTFTVGLEGFASCTFSSISDALEEIRVNLENNDDKIIVTSQWTTQAEYDSLPEFEGY